MTLNPDNHPSQRKEAILDQSPLVKHFVGTKDFRKELHLWSPRLSELSDGLQTEIISKIGGDNQAQIVTHMQFFLNANEIFDLKMDRELRLETTANLLSMGYEIGDSDPDNLLLPDIIARFKDCGLINPKLLANQEGRKKISHSFGRVLEVGKDLVRFGEQTMPDVFKKFIDGLDF